MIMVRNVPDGKREARKGKYKCYKKKNREQDTGLDELHATSGEDYEGN